MSAGGPAPNRQQWEAAGRQISRRVDGSAQPEQFPASGGLDLDNCIEVQNARANAGQGWRGSRW